MAISWASPAPHFPGDCAGAEPQGGGACMLPLMPLCQSRVDGPVAAPGSWPDTHSQGRWAAPGSRPHLPCPLPAPTGGLRVLAVSPGRLAEPLEWSECESAGRKGRLRPLASDVPAAWPHGQRSQPRRGPEMTLPMALHSKGRPLSCGSGPWRARQVGTVRWGLMAPTALARMQVCTAYPHLFTPPRAHG